MTAPTTETPPTKQPSSGEEDVLAVLSLVFMVDGSVRVQSAGVKANQLWGAAEMLRAMGNEMFAQARAEQAAADPRRRIMLPGR